MKWDVLRIIITCVAGGILSGVLGLVLLPVLRALKAGQSVHKIGPTWHNSKVGTPLMGGLMFIGSAIICLLINLFTVQNYTVLFFCYSNDGFFPSTFDSGESIGDGSDILKYILAAFVVPKSRLEPVFCTLLKASRNIALCASSRFKRKSMVSLTFLSLICL